MIAKYLPQSLKSQYSTSKYIFLLCLTLIGYGCTSRSPDEVQLEINSIQKTPSNGGYRITGSTNLPELSHISVAAVRNLRSPTQGLFDDADTNRSILDRQIVEVKEGKWHADLNIWKVAPNGSFQEVWQASEAQIKAIPDEEVRFIATFNPESQWQQLDNQTETSLPQPQNIEGKLLRFTNEGEKYVQASQIRAIPLPTGKTVPPRPLPEDFNGGWGKRYEIKSQPEATKSILSPPANYKETTAPLSVAEFLR